MEKDSAVMQNTNYKLLDLMKFICAFLVIGIHTRPLQSVSDVADKLFYYDISNYAVPFFYACTGYFLIVRQQNKGVHEKICFRIKKVLRLYVIWSIICTLWLCVHWYYIKVIITTSKPFLLPPVVRL